MPADVSRLRTLLVMQLLQQETDADHGVTMPQIVQYLEEHDVPAERKAVYRDLKVLADFGMDIRKRPTSPVEYALFTREFAESELLLLADAVQSSRFLTKTKAEELLRSLRSLGSRHMAKSLNKRVHVQGRVSMPKKNESVFANVDCIQQAIAARKKVSFQYFSYDCSANPALRHGGDPYVGTPVGLIYSDGSYYLTLYSDKYGDFANYRVDRMTAVRVTDEPASRNATVATFDPDAYQQGMFGMWNAEPVKAVLRVSQGSMDGLIDRFGRDVDVRDRGDGTATAYVTVTATPPFFGWLAQFGGNIRIDKPASLQKDYTEFLSGIIRDYGH